MRTSLKSWASKFSRSNRRRRPSRGRRTVSRRFAGVEQLEGRHMMAVVASFTDNQLSIIGDAAADTVAIGTVDVGGVAQVTVNGQGVGSGVNASAVTSIFANLGGGNDTMNLVTLDLTKFSGLTDGSIEIRGGAGNDTLVGSPLADVLKGEDGNDTLNGGAGNDTLIGGNGNDTLIGGAGDDILDGGAGDDMYSFSGSTDLGSDTVVQATSGNLDTLGFGSFGGAIVIDISMTTPQVVRAGLLTLTLSDANGIDNVQGTAYDDVILGNSGGNSLMGNGGNDYLWGRGGNDWLDGGSGNDTLYGGDGNDTLLGKGGNDSLYGHAGDDTLNGNEGNDYLSGDEGDDTYIVTNYGTKTIAEAEGAGSDSLSMSGHALNSALDLTSTEPQSVAPSLYVRFTTPGGVDWRPGAGDLITEANHGLDVNGIYTVPGAVGTTSLVTFQYGGAWAAYHNTVWVTGTNPDGTTIAPRHLFTGKETNPDDPSEAIISVPYKAGTKLSFFIEQDGSPDDIFFSDNKANDNDSDPDSNQHHVKVLELRPGVSQLTWEDLYYELPNPSGYVQDEDFNDLFMSVTASARDVPVVSIKAIDAEAHVAGLEPGVYALTRQGGDLTLPLSANLSLTGTAHYGFQYSLSSNLPAAPLGNDGDSIALTFPSGVDQLFVTLAPIQAGSATIPTVANATVLDATGGALYVVDSAYRSAEVTIFPDAQNGDLTISGHVRYEGLGGPSSLVLFPLRGALVEIWDDNGFAPRVKITETYTNENGYYEARISSEDTFGEFGGNVDPVVIVVAQSRPEQEIMVAHSVSLAGTTAARKEHAPLFEAGPGAAVVDVITYDTVDPENAAFSVFDAMHSFTAYHASLPGVSAVTVHGTLIPSSAPRNYYDDGTLFIKQSSRFGWDTIGHEYGHFAHNNAGVQLLGGDHLRVENLRFRRGSDGFSLAFTEGFATYFSLIAQENTPKPPVGVFGFADTSYSALFNLDVYNATDVETGSTESELSEDQDPTYRGAGEDNEQAVYSALWDLADGANDDLIGDVGAIRLWDLITKGSAVDSPTFNALYQDLVTGVDASRVFEIGSVLALNLIVPSPLRVEVDGVPAGSVAAGVLPTFIASVPFGVSYPDIFDHERRLFGTLELRFYSADGLPIAVRGSTVLQQPAVPSEAVSDLAWVPTAEQWLDIRSGANGQAVSWSVVGRVNGIDFQSEYESDVRSLLLG